MMKKLIFLLIILIASSTVTLNLAVNAGSEINLERDYLSKRHFSEGFVNKKSRPKVSVEKRRKVGPTLMTPFENFENLEGWPYESKYTTVYPGNLSMAYIDEGPRDGPVVLLLHGNPTWSYSFRNMIPPLVAEGYRVIAPDLIGFGKSEKPILREDQNYSRQVMWVANFIKRLELQDINVFAQDWGGLIATRIVAFRPNLFDRVVLSNAGLPTNDFDAGELFSQWQDSISQTIEDFSFVVQTGTVNSLSENELAAYRAPFPEGQEGFKAGPRQLPRSLPTKNKHIDVESRINLLAKKKLSNFRKPFLTIFSVDEAEIAYEFQKLVPGARGLPHQIWANIGHFSQDDAGEDLANEIINLIRNY